MTQNELYHYGILGMKWGQHKNYYGKSGNKYVARNGVTVGAPKNASVAAFRKFQGTRIGAATLNGSVKLNTKIYGGDKTRRKKIEDQVRRENIAVREANKAHKDAINSRRKSILRNLKTKSLKKYTKKYANDRAQSNTNSILARMGTMRLKDIKNMYE